jgi:outer membrane murein-binding lipoprotein Lpp
MPMSPAELEHKVRQLDNDVQSIYEMLSTIQATQTRHGNRIGELDQRVIALDGKVDILDGKVDILDGKIDALGAQMGTALDLLRER